MNCNLWIEGREITRRLKTGDFEVARKQLSHLLNRIPANKELSLDYKRDFFKSFLIGILFALPANGNEKSVQYEDIMETCFQCLDETESWRELKSCILKELEIIVSLFTSWGTHREKIIIEARLYIEKHFRENITQTDLLQHLSVSRSWLKRFFKRQTGLTFTEYLRKRRVEEACSLLSASNSPLWKVAYDSGLRTDRTLRRAFHEELGISPQAYRKNHGAE